MSVITIQPKIALDVALLRQQRDWLLTVATLIPEDERDHHEGLVNLIDYLLDKAEGF